MQGKTIPNGIFGNNLRFLRNKARESQEEAAAAIQVEQPSIGRYERGRVPTSEILLRIANHYNVDVVRLLKADIPNGMAAERYHLPKQCDDDVSVVAEAIGRFRQSVNAELDILERLVRSRGTRR